MRDRLIEVLREPIPEIKGYNDIGVTRMSIVDAEKAADRILSDGWIRLPCKVGDTVYVKYYGEIVNAYVTEFEINSKGIVVKAYIDPDTYMEYDAEDVFLTKEEAERALQEGKI